MGNGGSIIFKRSWLDECIEKDGHVYNESFVVAEDWELIWRMRRRGLKVVYVPVKTRHLRRVTAKSYIRHQFYRGVGIAQLYKLQREAGPGMAVQESLIWGQEGTRHGARWITAFVQKAIGPFNWKQFSRGRYFWTHWLAEKFQGAGFVWGLIAY
ncbi:MAG: hypothetical protein HZB26_18255 [Candidatus Hydrogenedentes bacterium]|nr:hypothetical protein [Candidatus Hydrogenedentota bacterium]